MTQSCNREHLDEALKDPSTLTLFEKYHAYEEKISDLAGGLSHKTWRTHPGTKDLFSKGAIAVARSMIPGALSAVDKTMEETWLHWTISQFGAYQRCCRTTSTRAQFYQKTLEMVDLIKDPDCPWGETSELEKAEVKKGEEAIQRTIETIKNFTNPFTISDKDRLYPGFWCSCPHGGRDGRATSRNCGQGC
ncbi:hypothetical protein F7725_022441 [Dissostichus mawsoni]|uniref:Uncharacterized protein n=1 Tax=Dissostichus mawsoni TaxID=36200 RepID=A0A7J5YYA6_DISMA|nr:hypothetical protein F7725_022441 [Dissostichus mawsoni]